MGEGMRFAGAGLTAYSVPVLGITAATAFGGGVNAPYWWKIPLVAYGVVPGFVLAVVLVVAVVWKLWGVR